MYFLFFNKIQGIKKKGKNEINLSLCGFELVIKRISKIHPFPIIIITNERTKMRT